MTIEYITAEAKAVLDKQMASLSPGTAHKLLEPYCWHCLMERGKRVIEQINSGTYTPRRYIVRE